MRDCDNYIELSALLIDGHLSEGEEAALRAHMIECADCRKRVAEYTAIHDAFALAEPPDTLVPGVIYKLGLPKRKTGIRRFIPRGFALAAACVAVILLIASADHGGLTSLWRKPTLSEGNAYLDNAGDTPENEAITPEISGFHAAGTPENNTQPEAPAASLYDNGQDVSADVAESALTGEAGEGPNPGNRKFAGQGASPSIGEASPAPEMRESLWAELFLPESSDYAFSLVAAQPPDRVPEGERIECEGWIAHVAEYAGTTEVEAAQALFGGMLLEGTGEKYLVVLVEKP